MLSMTGFGKAKVKAVDGWVVAEISSVNKKQLEISVHLPKDWSGFENEVREEILPAVHRGRVQVTVYHLPSRSDSRERVDMALAKEFALALQKMKKTLKLDGDIRVGDILRAPGVIVTEHRIETANLLPALKAAASQALKDWLRMREKEGAHLKADLLARISLLQKARARVLKRAPLVLKQYRETLQKKLQKNGFQVSPDNENFRKDLFMFADRCDISEELTRLESHYNQFVQTLKKGGAAGRKLEFLLQEIQREVNTLGSKGNDLAISHEVVEMKTEIEKVREQVQNIE